MCAVSRWKGMQAGQSTAVPTRHHAVSFSLQLADLLTKKLAEDFTINQFHGAESVLSFSGDKAVPLFTDPIDSNNTLKLFTIPGTHYHSAINYKYTIKIQLLNV